MKEVIKAALITQENFETIKVLAQTNDLAPSSVKEGSWLVAQTIRIPPLFGFPFVHQCFYIVRDETLRKDLRLIGFQKGLLQSFDAERRETTTNLQNNDVKELTMPHCPMTTAYILYMIDRYGSRTHEVLMDYGRDSKEILEAFKKAREEGYVENDRDPKKPYLTPEGRNHMHEYYGNDFNGYDE